MIPCVRLWEGEKDLREMQELAIEHRRRRGVHAPWHTGGLAWVFTMFSDREHDWTVRVWEDDGRVVAWSWLHDGDFDHDVHPDHRHLLEEMLDEPAARHVFADEDDAETMAALGFTEPAEVMDINVLDMLEAPEPPELPDGFRYRTVAPDDLAERVAVHRDVWAPSNVTEASYVNVMATWPYTGSLDCVVEAPDRRFAAYALLWPDDANSVGELEPVGVREEFRRRGLGTAVCRYALRRWYDEGGRQALVGCMTESACALYRSLGFERATTMRGHAR